VQHPVEQAAGVAEMAELGVAVEEVRDNLADDATGVRLREW
jgi:hypothetical protein